MNGLIDAVFSVRAVLEDLGVAHALIGGMAANLFREEPRATADVDVMLLVRPAEVSALIERFRSDGWKVESFGNEAQQLRLRRAKLPRVDCILATTDFERSAVTRAVEFEIEGRSLKVVAPDDLVVLKLIAGRARDYETVVAMLNAGRVRLDPAYIEAWLEQFGVKERWARALEEARREATDGR